MDQSHHIRTICDNMRRTRAEKRDEADQGPSPDPALRSPENKTGASTRHADEEPTNRALLSAIQELKNEANKNKEDICRILDTRIEQVYNDLRGEINAVKTHLLAPIAKLEANSQALNNTVREIEQAANTHSERSNSSTLCQGSDSAKESSTNHSALVFESCLVNNRTLEEALLFPNSERISSGGQRGEAHLRRNT